MEQTFWYGPFLILNGRPAQTWSQQINLMSIVHCKLLLAITWHLTFSWPWLLCLQPTSFQIIFVGISLGANIIPIEMIWDYVDWMQSSQRLLSTSGNSKAVGKSIQPATFEGHCAKLSSKQKVVGLVGSPHNFLLKRLNEWMNDTVRLHSTTSYKKVKTIYDFREEFMFHFQRCLSVTNLYIQARQGQIKCPWRDIYLLVLF